MPRTFSLLFVLTFVFLHRINAVIFSSKDIAFSSRAINQVDHEAPPPYVTVWPPDIIQHGLLPYFSDIDRFNIRLLNRTFYKATYEYYRNTITYKEKMLLHDRTCSKLYFDTAALSSDGMHAAYADNSVPSTIILHNLAILSKKYMYHLNRHEVHGDLWFDANQNINAVIRNRCKFLCRGWNSLCSPKDTLNRSIISPPHAVNTMFLQDIIRPKENQDQKQEIIQYINREQFIQIEGGDDITYCVFLFCYLDPLIHTLYSESTNKIVIRIWDVVQIFDLTHKSRKAFEAGFDYSRSSLSGCGIYYAFVHAPLSYKKNQPVTIKVLNLKNMELNCLKEIQDLSEQVSLCFDATGDYIFIGKKNGCIELWDHRNNKCLQNIPGAHTKRITSMATSKNNKLLSTSEDGSVKLWQRIALRSLE